MSVDEICEYGTTFQRANGTENDVRSFGLTYIHVFITSWETWLFLLPCVSSVFSHFSADPTTVVQPFEVFGLLWSDMAEKCH